MLKAPQDWVNLKRLKAPNSAINVNASNRYFGQLDLIIPTYCQKQKLNFRAFVKLLAVNLEVTLCYHWDMNQNYLEKETLWRKLNIVCIQ